MKNINLLKYLSIIILISFTFSCSRHDSSNEEKSKIYNLDIIPKLGVMDSNISELKKNVFNDLLNKKPIKYSDITQLLIEEQVNYYNQKDSKSSSVETITNWVNDISSVNNESSNIEYIKVLYQTKKLNMNDMKYNKEATSIPYILHDNRFQCYSSTMLHQLVLRNHSNFENFNSVVIYESGRILSGYMIKYKNTWNLIGIENTVKGKGISSKVVYNLGSSYYKNGNKGKAMGAYLVARSLNPIDSDIKYNINFLKDSLTDSLEVESLSSWDVVFFWNFFLNKKLSLYLVALIFALLELCIFLYMIRYKRNIMKYLSIVLGVVFIVGLSGLYVKINAPVWTATVSDSVEVYSGPSDENSVLFNLHEAAPVMIEEKLDDWRKIKLSDGKTGWLKAKEVWTLLEDRG